MLAEKAETGVFETDAIIRSENGLEQFKTLDPAAIVKHLAYDGTKLAANSKKANEKRFSGKPSLPLHWPRTTLDHVTSLTL